MPQAALLFLTLLQIAMMVKGRSTKPNIVVLMTDDQDTELGSLSFMPETGRLLRAQGAEMLNGMVSTPMCCPSRSSVLTGVYAHNHNVFTNNDNCSSLQWQREWETRSFATYLSNAGYRTGYFGKYLNQYTGTHIPAGWTEWVGLIRNSRYYNYTLNFNGQKVKHADNYHQDYLSDLIANDSVTFLKQSKQYFPDTPVAMVLSFPAPHGPEDSAPPYQDWFANITTHRTPSWNYAPNPDKQWLLQHLGKMEPIHIAFTDILHRKRLQTLQSVDQAVLKLITELEALGELDNTYILFTSDHGYHLGQFGLIKGKAMPYEFDIRVPFIIRGPGIPPGIRLTDIALNIDVAPTILDMAQIDIPGHMDGQSLLKLFRNISPPQSGEAIPTQNFWRDTVLIERGKVTGRKIKDRELMEAKQTMFHLDTKAKRLQEECQKGEYQPPCKGNQQWECRRRPNGAYRMVKCRYGNHSDACIRQICPDNPEYEFYSNRLQGRKKRSTDNKQANDMDCRVLSNGSVVCDRSIYSERSAWIQEKEVVNADIEKLRQRLKKLKDIKKHLREWRPLTDEQEYIEEVEKEANIIDDDPLSLEEIDADDDGNQQKGTNRANNTLQSEVIQSTSEDFQLHLLPGGCICEKKTDSSRWRLRRDVNEQLSRKERKDQRRERRRQRQRRRRRKDKNKANKDPSRDCTSVSMKCFDHDNDHWKTPPLWNMGPFCFCPNSNNNTYWCVRTVNTTHNFLYCEFITGFMSFYNLTEDPYQLRNAVHDLSLGQLKLLQQTLHQLRSCSGQNCTFRSEDVIVDIRRSNRKRSQQRQPFLRAQLDKD